MNTMAHGDFTNLAEDYAKYRPGYSGFVADMVMGLLPEKPAVADVGAGTGIWSEMLAARGALVTAVEPNTAMRAGGAKNGNAGILRWIAGSAENTTLPDAAFDLVCMASSFHWPDFDLAIHEFDRIVKPGGYFLALWNVRRVDANPLLARIESKLKELAPGIKRKSSGNSEFCNTLTQRLESSTPFRNVVYLQGRHVELQSSERYLGLWRSVNDIQVQMGADLFRIFLSYIEDETRGLEFIEAEYTTRAWIARRGD